MPENTFLERLFKPSIKWLDELQPPKETGSPEPNIVVPMNIEPDDVITRGLELEVTRRLTKSWLSSHHGRNPSSLTYCKRNFPRMRWRHVE